MYIGNIMKHDVENYLQTAPLKRRERLQVLHLLILGLFPEAVINMQYKMPTYHVGEGWVAIANQKNYVSLYTCGYYHIEQFKTKHPEVSTGKGCIRFKDRDVLPLSDLRFVVKHAIKHPKSKV